MKRTNLVLDEQLFRDATETSGWKKYSAAVNTLLAEIIRTRKVKSLSRFFGSGI